MPKGDDGLALVFQSGDFGRVYYGLAMAAAALALNRPAMLFFTMGAIRALAANGGWVMMDGAPPPADQNAGFAARGVATFDELFAACAELGGRFIVCDMGLKAMDMTADDLRGDAAIEVAGLATLYAAGGDVTLI